MNILVNVNSTAVFYDRVEDEDSDPHQKFIGLRKRSITFGDSEAEVVAFQNVDVGKMTKESTDAMNNGQLYSLDQGVVNSIGGGAGYDENGKWPGPKFKVKTFKADVTESKEESTSIAKAFDAVNDSMTNINDRIKDVEKNVSSNGLAWNEEKGGYDASHVDNNGVLKSPGKIINIDDGKIKNPILYYFNYFLCMQQ
ncbi:hypothetical protein [Bartonella sp. TT121SHDZB]|uniref:hypothetical protein n=1 Tax=Bartonella sp. TT121SHDZB TaxID=3243580 RepID=UPI0035CE8839